MKGWTDDTHARISDARDVRAPDRGALPALRRRRPDDDATLIEATPLGASRGAGRQPFSIVFLGPAAPVWRQRIYRVEHSALDPLDVFLVPVGPRDGGMQYQAIFT